ncbi:MAG: sulfite reductase subunit A [Desulfobacteraceae bacterium]|nr:MAG: sulfite reductase subunit A [Desulfobacteraceae bacterium]
MYEVFLLEKERLLPWLDDVRRGRALIGPIEEQGFPVFGEPSSTRDLRLDYGLTMMGPQTSIYRLTEKICSIRRINGTFEVDDTIGADEQLLVGVHSCDLHALLVLDKAFLKGKVIDRNYRIRREKTIVIGYHCTSVCAQCFCASMGTGPFFGPKEGYDFLLTDLGEIYMLEALGERAHKLIAPLGLHGAEENHFRKKEALRQRLLGQFTKRLDTSRIVEIILRNQDHPVWRRTAEERCLSCTNCTKVCPTCFCYSTKDKGDFALKQWDRMRAKDSCQEVHFAEVHGGNFRGIRAARLRQFVTHKLATWWEQFDCFGCIGCGRCMTWCPTGIDLTHMAKEIMATEGLEMR